MSKERLTDYISKQKIYDYIKAQINPYGKPFDGTAYEFGLKIMDYIKNSSCDEEVEKLKQYRDLEEQGLLLRLPVAVGSKVYEIIEETVPEHHYYIAEYEVRDVSAKAVMYADDWYSFDYPDLYFSRAEAEEKLRELEGK